MEFSDPNERERVLFNNKTKIKRRDTELVN